MIRDHRPCFFAGLTLAACLLPAFAPFALSGQQPQANPAQKNQPSPPGQSVSPSAVSPLTPAEFASRLSRFDQIVAACRQAPSVDHCPSSQIDLTLQLQLSGGARSISFLWLRAILDEAAHPPKSGQSSDSKSAANPKPKLGEEETDLPLDQLPTIQARLGEARQRLAAERAQALAASSAASPAASDSTSDARRHTLAANLTAILAGKDYHAINPNRTLRQRILEKIQEWLLRFFSTIRDAGRGKRWIGIAAQAAFIILLLTALFWFLIRLERQGRLAGSSLAPGLGAASARDWQLWLEDARRAAARKDWRDAVHYLYWSSISRLESSGLWPADRARTPREYLALLASTHAQRPALLALTHTFERTWYAGRPASEADFLQAEKQASQLGARRGDRDNDDRNPAPQTFGYGSADSSSPESGRPDSGSPDMPSPEKAGSQ